MIEILIDPKLTKEDQIIHLRNATRAADNALESAQVQLRHLYLLTGHGDYLDAQERILDARTYLESTIRQLCPQPSQ